MIFKLAFLALSAGISFASGENPKVLLRCEIPESLTSLYFNGGPSESAIIELQSGVERRRVYGGQRVALSWWKNGVKVGPTRYLGRIKLFHQSIDHLTLFYTPMQEFVAKTRPFLIQIFDRGEKSYYLPHTSRGTTDRVAIECKIFGEIVDGEIL